MITEEEWKEEWKTHKKKIELSQDCIKRINEVLEFKNLPPEIAEQIKTFNKSIRLEHGERVNLTIKN